MIRFLFISIVFFLGSSAGPAEAAVWDEADERLLLSALKSFDEDTTIDSEKELYNILHEQETLFSEDTSFGLLFSGFLKFQKCHERRSTMAAAEKPELCVKKT